MHMLLGLCVRRSEAYFTDRSKWDNQISLILGDLARLFENLKEDRIFGRKSQIDRILRVQATVTTATYLYLIISIRARLLEGLAS